MSLVGLRRRPLPLVPDRFRLPAWCVVAACVLVLVILVVRYRGTSGPGRLDLGVEHWLRANLIIRESIVRTVAYVGSWALVVAVAIFVVCCGYFGARGRGVLLAALGPAAALGVTESLKPVIGRTIKGFLALPSGHATILISLFTVTAIVLLRPCLRRFAMMGALVVFALAAGVLGAAAVLEHLHYFTDIIAGSCVGFSVVVLVALALDWARPRTVSRPPAAS